LSRCQAFAEKLAGETGLPLSFDKRLKEVGFGSWEGKTAIEINALEPESIFNFKRDPVKCRPAGAEPLDAFYNRVASAYDDIVEMHAEGHVLVVAHAGVIRMAICRVLGLAPEHGYRIQVGSAAMTRFKIERQGDRCQAALLHLTPGQ
jgi:alpha-ribazole phosphatase/probable phosphoglycerate mutase